MFGCKYDGCITSIYITGLFSQQLLDDFTHICQKVLPKLWLFCHSAAQVVIPALLLKQGGQKNLYNEELVWVIISSSFWDKYQ